MYCTACGAKNEPGTQFCTACGVALNSAVSPAPVPQAGYPAPMLVDSTLKSKLAAGLLGIFLGGFGIGRFYLGYQNIAIAQLATGVIGLVLLPFTCGLIYIGACVWGLIDGIMILTGSVRTDGQGRPLRD